MPQLPYKFLINPFLAVTAKSYKKLLSIAEDHRAKLLAHQAEPDIAAISAAYNPVLDGYKQTDMNLQSAMGTYEGRTQTVEELFAEVNKTRLPLWEGQVHFFYPEGTKEETAFFPNGRRPFQEGTYEQRIRAIKVLGDKCAADAGLASAGAAILAFWTTIEGARMMQQSQGEGAVDTLRALRETARIALCRQLYANLGLLMNKHKNNPLEIAQYFEFSYLRPTGDESHVSLMDAD